MLENYEIIHTYNADRSSNQHILDERIPDLHFARYGQNDDVTSNVDGCEFTGQYDMVARERKRIQAELRKNNIEVKFRNASEDDDDLDEIMQGMYRTDRRSSKSKQVFQIAQEDQIDCGYGAWRLYTEDENDDPLSANKRVAREPIPEAIRKVFWDSDSKLMDKSDAKRCSVIHEFNKEGYKRFLEDHGINKKDLLFTSFDSPYQSIYEQFYGSAVLYPQFRSGEDKLTILEFYSIEPVSTMYYIYRDESGELYAEEKSVAEERELGEPLNKKRLQVNKCYKYLSNGIEVLKRIEVAGGMIPIIPIYGERNFVNGVENFYGLVKAAKDPQKLINSCLNYLANMMMYSPVPKPEFDKREIEGLDRYHEGHAQSHTNAYVLRNKMFTDEDTGQTLDFTNATYTRSPEIPQSVAQMLGILPQLTDQILTSPGITDDTFNTNASGVAIEKIQQQIGMMSYIFLDNYAEGLRQDARVWAAMTSAITDTERKVVVTNSDGTTAKETIQKTELEIGMKDGEVDFKESVERNVNKAKFNIHFDVGPSYESQREAELAGLKELYSSLDPNDPFKRVVMLMIISKEDGEGVEELNKVARYQLLDLGLPGIEPQNDAEIEYVQQRLAQQMEEQGKPDQMQQLIDLEAAKGKIAGYKDVSIAQLNEQKTITEQIKQKEMLTDINLSKVGAAADMEQQRFDNSVEITKGLEQAAASLLQ